MFISFHISKINFFAMCVGYIVISNIERGDLGRLPYKYFFFHLYLILAVRKSIGIMFYTNVQYDS